MISDGSGLSCRRAALGRALGRLPERLELIGIEGHTFAAGCGLTRAVDEAVERVTSELWRG